MNEIDKIINILESNKKLYEVIDVSFYSYNKEFTNNLFEYLEGHKDKYNPSIAHSLFLRKDFDDFTFDECITYLTYLWTRERIAVGTVMIRLDNKDILKVMYRLREIVEYGLMDKINYKDINYVCVGESWCCEKVDDPNPPGGLLEFIRGTFNDKQFRKIIKEIKKEKILDYDDYYYKEDYFVYYWCIELKDSKGNKFITGGNSNKPGKLFSKIEKYSKYAKKYPKLDLFDSTFVDMIYNEFE